MEICQYCQPCVFVRTPIKQELVPAFLPKVCLWCKDWLLAQKCGQNHQITPNGNQLQQLFIYNKFLFINISKKLLTFYDIDQFPCDDRKTIIGLNQTCDGINDCPKKYWDRHETSQDERAQLCAGPGKI